MREWDTRQVNEEGRGASRTEETFGSARRAGLHTTTLVFKQGRLALKTLSLIDTIAKLATLQASKAF